MKRHAFGGDCYTPGERACHVDEHPDGEYVLWSDVEPITRELADARARVAELEAELEDLNDPSNWAARMSEMEAAESNEREALIKAMKTHRELLILFSHAQIEEREALIKAMKTHKDLGQTWLTLPDGTGISQDAAAVAIRVPRDTLAHFAENGALPAARGVCGDTCTVNNECGRIGCPECQQ